MIQGGDPNTKSGDPSTWGTGGPGYKVNQEFNPIPHKRGILSMARTGDPNGAGSQFFVMHADYPSLNNQYTVFGAVVTGIETVDKIVMTPTTDNNGTVEPGKAVRIKGVKLAKWPVK
jgi:cyclophilin family peptidyl-prolyl cis-trans isomerase